MANKIPYSREFMFHDTRKWRFDFVVLDGFKINLQDKIEIKKSAQKHKLAIEIEGGIFVNGRHNRPSGYVNDMLKYNEAVINGWRVLRYTTPQFRGTAIEDIKRIVGTT
tara:strand:+ start:1683 stop:2009 length:327 start_codon:yes stop_codon:yes gene_type:complete